MALPDGPLQQRQVEAFWAQDRAALMRCGISLAGLVTYYEALAQTLSAADRSP